MELEQQSYTSNGKSFCHETMLFENSSSRLLGDVSSHSPGASQEAMSEAIRGARATVSSMTTAMKRPTITKRDSQIEADLLRELHSSNITRSRPTSMVAPDRLSHLQREAGHLDERQTRLAQAQKARAEEETHLFQSMQESLETKSQTISDQMDQIRELQSHLMSAVEAKLQAEKERDDALLELSVSENTVAQLRGGHLESDLLQSRQAQGMTEQANNLLKQLQHAQAQNQALETQVQMLRQGTQDDQDHSYREELRALQDQRFEALRSQLKSVSFENQQLQNGNAMLEDKLRVAHQTLEELSSETHELGALHSDLAHAQLTIAALKKKLEMAPKSGSPQLKAQLEEALERGLELQQDCDTLVSQNQALRKKLQSEEGFVHSLIDSNMRVETSAKRTISNLTDEMIHPQQGARALPAPPPTTTRKPGGINVIKDTHVLLIAKQREIEAYKAAAGTLRGFANEVMATKSSKDAQANLNGLKLIAQTALSRSRTDTLDKLPDGWDKETTKEGVVYYIDHRNKRTSWVHPQIEHSLPGTGVVQQQQRAAPIVQDSNGGEHVGSLQKFKKVKSRRKRAGRSRLF